MKLYNTRLRQAGRSRDELNRLGATPGSPDRQTETENYFRDLFYSFSKTTAPQ